MNKENKVKLNEEEYEKNIKIFKNKLNEKENKLNEAENKVKLNNEEYEKNIKILENKLNESENKTKLNEEEFQKNIKIFENKLNEKENKVKLNEEEYEKNIKILENKYDNNCYVFLLKFFAGDFLDAYNLILSVSSNIPGELFNYITEEDLAFFFCLCILINYKDDLYKEILVQNETAIYKMIEKFPKIFEILEIYSKCQFEKVCVLYDKIFKEKINKNRELVNYEKRINMTIKNNILKEILSLSTEIKLEDLAKTLKIESVDKLIDMIIKLIDDQNFPVKIDDINKIVYYNKKNELDDALKKTLNTSKKNLAKIFNFTIKQLKGKNKISQTDMNGISQVIIKDEFDERQFNQFQMEGNFNNIDMMHLN